MYHIGREVGWGRYYDSRSLFLYIRSLLTLCSYHMYHIGREVGWGRYYDSRSLFLYIRSLLTLCSYDMYHIGREVGWGRYLQSVLPPFRGDLVPDLTPEHLHYVRIWIYVKRDLIYRKRDLLS